MKEGIYRGDAGNGEYFLVHFHNSASSPFFKAVEDEGWKSFVVPGYAREFLGPWLEHYNEKTHERSQDSTGKYPETTAWDIQLIR